MHPNAHSPSTAELLRCQQEGLNRSFTFQTFVASVWMCCFNIHHQPRVSWNAHSKNMRCTCKREKYGSDRRAKTQSLPNIWVCKQRGGRWVRFAKSPPPEVQVRERPYPAFSVISRPCGCGLWLLFLAAVFIPCALTGGAAQDSAALTGDPALRFAALQSSAALTRSPGGSLSLSQLHSWFAAECWAVSVLMGPSWAPLRS